MSQASANKNVLGEPDESTRLVTDEERPTGSNAQLRPTPLPLIQLASLVAVHMADHIAYKQMFPYINQLLADLHIVPPGQVGFYTGFIESVYPLAKLFSVYQWGRLSDIIGRRPVMAVSPLCIAVTTMAFGLSTSLVTMLVSRFFGGLVAGNAAVLHSILVEVTDDNNQNMAVTIYSLSVTLGAVVGPLIGGTFANPATRYPRYFSWPIFIDHPHLLPCMISAVCALLGAWLGYTCMEETLPSKRKVSVPPSSTPLFASDTDTSATETRDLSVKALLAIPALRALTLTGFMLAFVDTSFNVVFTLFCYAPIDAGGLGLQPSTIGNFLAFAGTVAVFLRLAAMPYILRRFDYATTYTTCMYLWPIAFALLPLFNMLVRAGSPAHLEGSTGTTTADAYIWIGLALVLGLSRVAAMPQTFVMLLVKRHAPASVSNVRAVSVSGTGSGSASASGLRSRSWSTLGKSNGLVDFAMSVGHGIAPVVASALFTSLNGSTWARRCGIAPAWAVIMACLAVLGARMSSRIR